jgi:hypothetical protein
MRMDEFLIRLRKGHTRGRKQSPKPSRSPEPNLAIAADIFSDEIVRGLVDDCVIPALVEDFLRSKKSFTSGENGA